MTWSSFLSTLLTALFVSIAVVTGCYVYLFPRLMQRLPSSRLAKLEVDMSEVQQSFDGLLTTWKKFRNAEGMRELRATRLQARMGTSADPPQNDLKGAAWKEQARKQLGAALHNPRAVKQLHDQADNSAASGTDK